MKVRWNFLAALVAGFVVMAGLMILAFYLNLGVPSGIDNQTGWTFAVTERKRMLAEQTASPKLLLVGGSGTLFGVSARELERQTGWRSINLGTHAALNTTYLLSQAQQVAKPGDAVLLILEYELYTYGRLNDYWASDFMVDYLVSYDTAFLRSLPLWEQWNVFMLTSNRRLWRGLKDRSRHRTFANARGIYNVSNLNECGDQTHHPAAAKPSRRIFVTDIKSILGYDLPKRPKGFASLASFCRWARANHVRVLATYPNVCDQPEYHQEKARKTAATIKDFFATLDVPMIGNYTDALLPANEFFDTYYHLTEEACAARTQLLAQQLKPHLQPQRE